MKVAFAGGVTGGHIAPGVALAEKILADCPGSEVLFASVANETEERMIARSRGLPLVKISERNTGTAAALMHAPAAVFRARRLFASFKPDVVVGLGGGASLGAALAAATMRKPLVLLEQNAVPGRANKKLAPFASRICCQWERVLPSFGSCAIFTGSPVRAEIIAVPTLDKAQTRASFGLAPDFPTLLVMGGSQGATHINQAMTAAAPKLARTVQIIHLVGDRDEAALISEAYRTAGIAAHVPSFLHDMHLAYAAADVALSRAGAISIAELAAAGLPAILVPYPHATDDHQRANTHEAVKQGWAVRLEQDEMDAERTAALISTMLAYGARLDTMKRKALASARNNAADVILEVLAAACNRGKKQAPKAKLDCGG